MPETHETSEKETGNKSEREEESDVSMETDNESVGDGESDDDDSVTNKSCMLHRTTSLETKADDENNEKSSKQRNKTSVNRNTDVVTDKSLSKPTVSDCDSEESSGDSVSQDDDDEPDMKTDDDDDDSDASAADDDDFELKDADGMGPAEGMNTNMGSQTGKDFMLLIANNIFALLYSWKAYVFMSAP